VEPIVLSGVFPLSLDGVTLFVITSFLAATVSVAAFLFAPGPGKKIGVEVIPAPFLNYSAIFQCAVVDRR
jgi:hypothetical protein